MKREKKMKTKLYTLLSLAVIALTVPGYSKTPVAVQTPGGQIEYNFFTKFSEQEAREVAEILSLATLLGRKVVYDNLSTILDVDLGDKGFTPDYFEGELRGLIEKKKPTLTQVQEEMLDKFMVSARMAVDMNQDRINVEGVFYKYFLPASWAKETIAIFRAQTGIPIKQSGPIYRIPSSKPDAFEQRVINRFNKAENDKKPFAQVGDIGGQKVYRYVSPIFINDEFCLKCHGSPKGELDMLGYEKEGLKLGDLRGIVSVAVPIENK